MPRCHDGTVRHAVSADLARVARAARQDGATAAEGEADKRERYPQARSPFPALPLALETYGRHGREALRYLRRLARSEAERSEGSGVDTAGALVSRWGRWLSVALHKANAAVLWSALGTERVAVGDLAEELAG